MRLYKILIHSLLLPFLLLSVNSNVFALEVSYPVIQQSSITTNSTFPEYAKYIFTVGMTLGFLAVFISLIVAGAQYILSPATQGTGMLSAAKDRAIGAISGLILLVLIYLITTTINPQLSLFVANKLPPNPPSAEQPKAPGIYAYKKTSCEDELRSYQVEAEDLGDIKNKINSVAVTHNKESQEYYVGILYNKINFSGKCQYLDPNKKCQNVESWGNSLSVNTYDFNPDGDGVYFFRKSNFDGNGGYYKVPNSEIKGIYVKKIEDLKFVDASAVSKDNPDGCTIPKEERDCTKFNKDGTCAKNGFICPNLGGENISSVKINGNYLVVFIYQDSKGSASGPWASCQQFPRPDDINKRGPIQIKWDAIRNSEGVIPNYVMILPIKKQ